MVETDQATVTDEQDAHKILHFTSKNILITDNKENDDQWMNIKLLLQEKSSEKKEKPLLKLYHNRQHHAWKYTSPSPRQMIGLGK